MATVTTQQIGRAGTATTYAAASSGGDRFTPTSDTFLHVKNGSGSSTTVTIATPITSYGLALADLAVAVPAGAERFIGPLPPDLFAASDGLADVTWSVTTTVTFAVLRLVKGS